MRYGVRGTTIGITITLLLLFGPAVFTFYAHGDQPAVQFSQSVDSYDFVEVTVQPKPSVAKNPFTDVVVQGQFQPEGATPISVDGFCDSADGSVYRIRFMAAKSGKYEYSVTYQQGESKKTYTGQFEVSAESTGKAAGKRRGIRLA